MRPAHHVTNHRVARRVPGRRVVGHGRRERATSSHPAAREHRSSAIGDPVAQHGARVDDKIPRRHTARAGGARACQVAEVGVPVSIATSSARSSCARPRCARGGSTLRDAAPQFRRVDSGASSAASSARRAGSSGGSANERRGERAHVESGAADDDRRASHARGLARSIARRRRPRRRPSSARRARRHRSRRAVRASRSSARRFRRADVEAAIDLPRIRAAGSSRIALRGERDRERGLPRPRRAADDAESTAGQSGARVHPSPICTIVARPCTSCAGSVVRASAV